MEEAKAKAKAEAVATAKRLLAKAQAMRAKKLKKLNKCDMHHVPSCTNTPIFNWRGGA